MVGRCPKRIGRGPCRRQSPVADSRVPGANPSGQGGPMSLITPRSQLVRCANRHCRAVVRSGDSSCPRCGSGQGARPPLRAQARLRRCTNQECRAFILDSDTRCGHCGCEAPAFMAFRYGATLLGRGLKAGLAAGAMILLVVWTLRIGRTPSEPPLPQPPTGSSSPSQGDGSGEAGR